MQRMGSTNHSQMVRSASFPSSEQTASESSKQCAKGIQTGDLGASPQLLSPHKGQRELGDCVGE